MQKLTGHETKSLSRSLSRSTTFNSEKDLTLLEIVSFEINVKEKDSENRFGNSIFFQFKNPVLHEERNYYELRAFEVLRYPWEFSF